MPMRTALAALVLLSLAPRPAEAGPARAPAYAPLPVIDAHTHPEFGEKPERREEYLRQWKAAGLTGAVGILHTHDGTLPDAGPGRVIFCAGLMGTIDAGRLEDGLRDGRYGCIKVYLGYEPYFASDPRYAPVYALAERYEVPVVFHTGDTDRATAHLKYADPLTVDEVVVAHPKVRFVLAHCGNPWIESAAEVAYKNPNVYLDGSALLTGDVSRLPREQVETYMVKPFRWIFGYVENPGKLLFASDWPVTNIPAYLAAFKRAIPRKHWRAVFHDNAALVFGFDRPARARPRPAP